MSQWLVIGFGAIALLGLLLLGKAYYDDSVAQGARRPRSSAPKPSASSRKPSG